MNITDLVVNDGYFLKRQASTNGGEYAGQCPWCGGKDRFRVWPKNGRYWCRQCNISGDCIQYLRDRRGMSYKDACHYLNIESKYTHIYKSNEYKEHTIWTPKTLKPLRKTWLKKAKEFFNGIDFDSEYLKRWLYNRGLSDKVIKQFALGWNKNDMYVDRKEWGLSDIINEKTKKNKKLWLPEGIVIPYIFNNDIIRLRIRRPKSKNGQRYIIVSGSDMRPMILNSKDNKIIVVVESELDGILINEKAGDIVCVIALGNAQSRPDKETHEILSKANNIILALDTDNAGAKESWQWWIKHYKNTIRWPCPIGKDPGEAYQKGVDIRMWIEAALVKIYQL